MQFFIDVFLSLLWPFLFNEPEDQTSVAEYMIQNNKLYRWYAVAYWNSSWIETYM